MWYENASGALVMEAYDVKDGVRLACDMRLQHVIIETDAQGVVNPTSDHPNRCSRGG